MSRGSRKGNTQLCIASPCCPTDLKDHVASLYMVGSFSAVSEAVNQVDKSMLDFRETGLSASSIAATLLGNQPNFSDTQLPAEACCSYCAGADAIASAPQPDASRPSQLAGAGPATLSSNPAAPLVRAGSPDSSTGAGRLEADTGGCSP